tara:strand:+ start:4799 stop:6025 length:1227 start_codon:yes stop_codon:yes gene_type:complete
MPRSASYHWTKKCWAASGLLIAYTCAPVTALASEPDKGQSSLRWHGFANQGIIKTDHNNFFGDSEHWSSEFSDLGLGGSWKPNSRLQFSAQAIYRRAGKNSQDNVQLDYGFADLNLVNTLDYGLGVRAGRVKNTYGLYNDARDIASNKPSILLPQSIYLDSLRQVFHTMDGLSSYGYAQWADTHLNLDVVYGKPLIDETTEQFILSAKRPGNIENEKMLIARIMLEQDAGLWRLGYSFAQLNSDYKPAPVDFSVSGEVNINLNLLSFEYNWTDWQITAEYQISETEYKGLNYIGYDNQINNESYYGQVSYRITPKWKTFARYDVYYINSNDKDGKKLEVETGGLVPAHKAFAKDITAGIRYDINKHWMLAAEYHHIKGTGWLALVENPIPSETSENWNLFTAQLSFKF